MIRRDASEGAFPEIHQVGNTSPRRNEGNHIRSGIPNLLLTAGKLAKKLNLDNGFRIVINNGPDGGESVPHLHVHLLGGRSLSWPPG